MLEIPESHTIARQMKETLTGKTVERVIAAQSPHGFAFYQGDPAAYSALLSGRAVTGASAFGGYAVLDTEGAHLSFSDGINVRYLSAEDKRPAKHQLLIEFTDGTAVVCSVQMYGAMLAYEGEPEGFYAQIARDKPSPLTDAFDEGYFADIVAAAPKNFTAKALLATKQSIPGLGNGCLQDVLFRARVNPRTKVTALSDGELAALFRSVKETLADMTARGGRDTEKDLFGLPGGYRTVLSSKTAALPCPACGAQIVRQAYLGGNVHFCPGCQPLKTV